MDGVNYTLTNQLGDTLANGQTRVEGSYDLTAWNECGLVDASFYLGRSRIPAGEIIQSAKLCEGASITLAFSDNESHTYQWSTNDTNQLIRIDRPGEYVLTVSSDHCISTFRSTVALHECDDACKAEISNVITPNQDGLNDLFKVGIDCQVSDYKLFIFNR